MRIARCSALTEGYEYFKKSCLFLFHDEFSFFFKKKKFKKRKRDRFEFEYTRTISIQRKKKRRLVLIVHLSVRLYTSEIFFPNFIYPLHENVLLVLELLKIKIY